MKSGGYHDCDSAGTSDWHIGDAPYEPMQAAARARGINMSDLACRQVRRADFEEFDLILGMDAKNLSALQALAPTGCRARLGLLTDFGDGSADHVPDPYYTGDFDGAVDQILSLTDTLVKELAGAD